MRHRPLVALAASFAFALPCLPAEQPATGPMPALAQAVVKLGQKPPVYDAGGHHAARQACTQLAQPPAACETENDLWTLWSALPPPGDTHNPAPDPQQAQLAAGLKAALNAIGSALSQASRQAGVDAAADGVGAANFGLSADGSHLLADGSSVPDGGAGGAAGPMLSTYPDPGLGTISNGGLVGRSALYSVQVCQGTRCQPSFVYQANSEQTPAASKADGENISNYDLSTSFTSFSFSGPVTVKVTRLSGAVAQPPMILPSRAGIESQVDPRDPRTVDFTVQNPGQFSVELDPRNPMLIFANPPETKVPKPSKPGDPHFVELRPGQNQITYPPRGPNDKVTFSFDAGVHYLDPAVIQSNTEIYLAPGAYVIAKRPTPPSGPSNNPDYLPGGGQDAILKGVVNAQNVTIHGPGVLSGQQFPFLQEKWVGGTRVDVQEKKSQVSDAPKSSLPTFDMIRFDGNATHGVNIDGVTLLDSPRFTIDVQGSQNAVSNVKVLTSWEGTSGINAVGQFSTVSHSFFKTNDDAICLTDSYAKYTDNVLWQQENGGTFQIGWNGSKDVHDVTVEHADVIHTSWDWLGRYQASKSKTEKNGVYPWWSANNAIFDAVYGGSGNIYNMNFDDVRVDGNNPGRVFNVTEAPNVWAKPGAIGKIHDLNFSNIRINGDAHPDAHPPNTIGAGVSATFTNVAVGGQPWTSVGQAGLLVDPSKSSVVVRPPAGP